MFRVLSIDPGNDTGWASWEDGLLKAAGLGAPILSGRGPIDLVLVEVPMVYPDRKVPPADLVKLAMTAGRQVERVRLIESMRNGMASTPVCLGVFPRTWKGTLDKDMMVRRIQTMVGPMNKDTAEACMSLSRVPLGKQHNVWDGVGLGHWAITQAMVGAKLGKAPLHTLRDLTDYQFQDL